MQKKENTWKLKKQNFKTEKKNGCKINGEKKEKQKGKKQWEKMDICIFLAFMVLFRFVCFLLFAFFPGKKQNKYKIKAKKSTSRKQYKRKTNANGQVIFFVLFDFPVFPLLFCFCVFWIWLICFLVFPCFFLAFVSFFSSLLILRISYGLVNIRVAIPKQPYVILLSRCLKMPCIWISRVSGNVFRGSVCR